MRLPYRALRATPLAVLALAASCIAARAGALPDGAWTQIRPEGPGTRASASGFYDARRDRYVFTGGYTPYTSYGNDVLTFDPSSGIWSDTPRPPEVGDLTFGGDAQVAYFDSLHDAAVVLNFELAYGGRWYRRLFPGDSLHWEEIPRSTDPDSLAVPGSIWVSAFDARRSRALTMGSWNGHAAVLGISAADRSIVWAAPAPPLVETLGLAYDPVRDRYLAFGTDTPIYLRTQAALRVWAWSAGGSLPTSWTEVKTTNLPPTIGYHSFESATGLLYDSGGDRLVVLLTEGEEIVPWTLSLTTGQARWDSLPTTGTTPRSYLARQVFADTRRNRFVAFGSAVPTAPSELWYLTLGDRAVWTRQQDPAASFHSGAAIALDAYRDRMLLFGGCTCESYHWPIRYRTTLRDTWHLDLAARPHWVEHASAPPHASAYGSATVYDAARDRFLAFGGTDVGDEPRFDATLYALRGALDEPWESLGVVGERPAPRAQHTVVFDAGHDRLVLFGGLGADGAALDDVWTLPLAVAPLRWQRLQAAGADSPAARYAHSAVYDPSHRRMVVYGGYATGFALAPRGDVWALELRDSLRWLRMGSPADSLGGDDTRLPRGRAEHAAVYDPIGRRMLVWGGRLDRVWENTFSADLWAFDLADATWRRLSPAGPPPAPRGQHAMVYDAAFDRLILFGGGRDRPLWSDGDHRIDTGIGFDDLWTLEFARAGATVPPNATPCTLRVPKPVIRRGAAATLRVALAARSDVTIRVLDVSGRQRSARRVGTLERGGQSIDAPETATLAPGIYLVRAEAAGGAAMARIVVVP